MKLRHLKLRLIAIAAVFLYLSGGGCGRSGASEDVRPVAAVTFPQQASLLKAIVGDRYRIVTLLPPGSDPETFEPSMATMKALTRADVYFTMGSPGFEQSVLRSVETNFPDLVVVDSSDGIDRLAHIHGSGVHTPNDLDHHHDDDSDGHHCPAADPHILTSIVNARKMARNMKSALSRINPKDSDRYSKGLLSLDSTLTAADDSIRHLLSSGSRPFVVLHPSLSYFARDYVLNQISLESEGKEPTPRQYEEIFSKISSIGPAVFVTERQHSSVRFKDAAKKMDYPVIEVDLNSENWIDQLFLISNSIAKKPTRQ